MTYLSLFDKMQAEVFSRKRLYSLIVYNSFDCLILKSYDNGGSFQTKISSFLFFKNKKGGKMKIAVIIPLILLALAVLLEAFRRRSLGEGLRWLLGLQRSPNLRATSDLTITVIVPAYNEENHISKTIESIKNQTRRPDRIIVIDDSSTDKTGLIARNMDVDVFVTPQNTGTKAQAQAFGLQFVSTDIVINIDADTILKNDAIERLMSAFSEDDVAAACGFVLPQVIETFWEKARFVEYLFGISVCKAAQDNWNGVLVSSGCFSAFRTNNLRKIGGFPDRSMAEDMDATWLLLEEGMRVKLVNDALCYALDPHNYSTYKNQVERWYRGFLQNIAIHKFRLAKNRRAFLFALWNLLSGIIFPLTAILTIFLMLKFGNITLGVIAVEIGIIGFSSAFEARKSKKTILAIKSLPNYLIVTYVNGYLFLKSVWLEWIKKERLSSWQKGHREELVRR